MAERKKKNSATSTPQKYENSQMDSPSKPEPEQAGASGSGKSGNAQLKTWDTYDASAGDGAKKDKEKKSRLKKVSNKFKKAFTGSKNSDHAGRQEKIPNENEEEESSKMAPAEQQRYLTGDDKEHVPVRSKKESLGAIPELSRTAGEEILSEEKKRESDASMEISNTELKKEMAALQEKNRELTEKLASTTEELQRSRLDSERSVKTIEDLKQKDSERGNNENEMHQRYKVKLRELETKNQSLEKNVEQDNIRFEMELKETKMKLIEVQGEVKICESKLEHTCTQKEHSDRMNLELRQKVEIMETTANDSEKKMEEKGNELKKVQEDLKSRTEEILRFYKEQGEAVKKFEDALSREILSQDKVNKLEKEVMELKNKLEQKAQLDQANREKNQDSLKRTTKYWETKLEQCQRELEREKILFTALEETLEKTKHELGQMEFELKKQKKEYEGLQTTSLELKIQLEKSHEEYQNQSKTFELERSTWLMKHEIEMKVTLESNAAFKQQLKECQARYAALEKGHSPPYVLKDGEDISIGVAHGLQVLNPTSTKLSPMERQKSVELLPGSPMQVGPDVSMHSSAPSSLMKEKYSGDVKGTEETSGLLKSEEEDLNTTYESPHTSLTEVVRSVTVNEDNMTDAVKINIQQEVALLQQKVQLLQSELEAIKTERANLYKIKDKYFSLVGERAILFQKFQETESQFKANSDQAAGHDDPNVQRSLIATEVNFHPKEEDIALVKKLEDKDMEIRDLKAQLQALSRKIFKANKDQSEMHSEEGIVEPSDLKEVAETLTFEIKSIKRQLTRAESDHSDINMENSALTKEMKKLEEENLKLQTKVAQLKEKLEYWKQKCENEGIDNKTTAQTAELTVTMLQIDLMELTKKLQRKGNEVQAMTECRNKLEDRLLITRRERDRQHDQITSLLAMKANLTEELDRYDSYVQDLGEFKVKSQQFKKALAMRITEVTCLKEEKAALVKEMQSMKDEIETRKLEVSFIQKDFEEERKDRERMASELDIAKGKWEVTRQELVDAAKEDLKKEKVLTEYAEAQFKQARETWNIKRSEHENEIHVLTDQVEILQTKVEELSLCIDQGNKESDAKLTVTEGRLRKERQQREQTFTELNHVTELLQCSQQEFKSRLAEADTIHEELKFNLEVMSADKSSIEDNLKQLQEEMHAKVFQYESEKNAALNKFDKLCEYSDQVQEKVGILESEKHVFKEEMEKMKLSFQEEIRKRISIQQDLEMKLEESMQHYGKEKQQWTKQLKSLDLLRRTMKSQLDEEKRDLVAKDEVINEYQKKLQLFRDSLQSMEYANAQYESDIRNLNIYKVTLEREIDQLQSQVMGGGDNNDDYLRLRQENNEIERQRAEYEAKFSTLVDDYRDLRQFAIQNGLKVPQRRIEDASQYPNRPAHSDPYVVKPFNPEAYNLQSSHNPIQEQRRARTEYASGHGPTYPSHSEPPMPHSPYVPHEHGSHSPRARVRRGSQDPTGGLHHDNAIRENELIDNIDDDITEAAANMEEKVIATSFVSVDDARPLDSNLICPLCGKQYRIGQIQHYKHHVDNCNYKPK